MRKSDLKWAVAVLALGGAAFYLLRSRGLRSRATDIVAARPAQGLPATVYLPSRSAAAQPVAIVDNFQETN